MESPLCSVLYGWSSSQMGQTFSGRTYAAISAWKNWSAAVSGGAPCSCRPTEETTSTEDGQSPASPSEAGATPSAPPPAPQLANPCPPFRISVVLLRLHCSKPQRKRNTQAKKAEDTKRKQDHQFSEVHPKTLPLCCCLVTVHGTFESLP